ncbi:MAG: LemA family protein [Bacteroidota bacterium]
MKSILPLAIFLIVVGGLAFLGSVSYQNKFVSLDENVANAFGNLQSDYQRRADLIPNLVNTVKGAANFEKETLDAVINARSKATSITIDPSNVTPEQLQQFQEAQNGISQSLGRLLFISENYPDLKATQAFRDLTVQLEGTENRIKVARNKYNEAVSKYNVSVRSFPGNLFAGIFGFDRKAQFEATEGAQNAPTVNFN